MGGSSIGPSSAVSGGAIARAVNQNKEPQRDQYGLLPGEERTVNVGGKDYSFMNSSNLPQNVANQISRDTAYQTGMQRGQDLFYNDPDMQMLRKRREDLSNGYDGQEMGALRETANNELRGQRSSYMRNLQSKVGRAGVGGARAAAMGASADAGFLNAKGDQERKMALDNANLKRQGVGDLQDFIMRQKYGVITSAVGEQGLDVADRTGMAQAAAAREAAQIAGREPDRGLLGNILGNLF